MPNETKPDWILPTLKVGLQKLLCLSLEGQPSADVIGGTLLAWHEVITHRRVFEESRDRTRFEDAFRTLAQRCHRWPTPADFLDALPRLEGEPRVKRIESRAAREAGMRAIADITAMLRLNEPQEQEGDDAAAA